MLVKDGDHVPPVQQAKHPPKAHNCALIVQEEKSQALAKHLAVIAPLDSRQGRRTLRAMIAPATHIPRVVVVARHVPTTPIRLRKASR